MCHGAGGIAGHVRFGARTATAPVLIGLVFLVLGVGFGASGYASCQERFPMRCCGRPAHVLRHRAGAIVEAAWTTMTLNCSWYC